MLSFEQAADSAKKGRAIKSAFDSESFESDGTIHVDGLVGSATISPSGRDIALASPEGLAIIDLDSPYNPPRRLRSHGLPWLVCDVQWSPFAVRDYWVVSTANHRALVWNLNQREDSPSGAIEHSLQGHSRAITDLNFSAHHPDLLATCSVDGYVHWWDLRRPRQPVLTFCDWFAGATQVKFNRQDPHVLASAHDRRLHIWDERRSCEPLKSISAHTSKIYGVDWNRTSHTAIATCSLDKSIKFWDYSKGHDGMLEHVVHTDYPIWRARHTPFGCGMLAMPQNEPGNLYLYDRRWHDASPIEATPSPVATFSGHGNHKAKEFLWRARGGISDNVDNREFQLVSWGTDNELRLHCIDSNIMSSVGHVKGGPARKGLSLTRQGAVYKTFRTVNDSSSTDRKAGTMSDHRSGTNTPHNKQQSLVTLGMRSATHATRQLRSSWRGPSMKAKVASTKGLDRSQAQLGWMRGITMTKRKPSTDVANRNGSKDAAMVDADYPEDDWGQPDTIQEELLRVNTQIQTVNWEHIDMDNLTLKASLTGPWGVNKDPIFIKVKIDVPAEYPKLKAPKFLIEKTSFMPEETHRKIVREIHQLASQFLQKKQNCLKVALSYLLGEVDLESSTSFFKNVQDLDDLDDLADESSSDDEDISAGADVTMSQELASHGYIDAILAPTSRNIIPPTPRTCGARFSNDGRLVCFFPSKEEKARALFSTSAELYNKERARGEPFFAGFGRLEYDAPSRSKLMADDASGSEEQSNVSDSDVSSSSSSDSDSTSIHKMSLWYRGSRQLHKTWSQGPSVRSSGAGTGAGTGTGTGTSRRIGKPKNFFSLHDLRAELPSKQEFAQEYIMFGDGAEVCQHNARVAEKHGYTDLEAVWRYLVLLLKHGDQPSGGEEEDGLSPCRDALWQSRQEGPSFLDTLDMNHRPLRRVRWGNHPLAWHFLADLFDHYEKMADVQMLAVLSCIFNESFSEGSVDYAEPQPVDQTTSLPIKVRVPPLSHNYLGTAEASAWGARGRSQTYSAMTTPGALQTPVVCPGSQGSDEAAWNGEAATSSFSCGETPPTKAKSLTPERAELLSPLSRSPNSRGIFRGNTGLASALMANLPRPFTGASSSSPPSQARKKWNSAETLALSGASASQASAPAIRTWVHEADECGQQDKLPLLPVSVSLVVEDASMFDDDGWLSRSLPSTKRADVYAAYRYAYAEMLQMWGQPLARLEVLKFNVMHQEPSSEAVDVVEGTSISGKRGSSPMVMGKKGQLHTLLASGRGLDVTGICRVHETQLEPARYTASETGLGGAVGTCERCHRTQTQLRCVVCLDPVYGLFPACLACGCASHMACLAEWHAAGETLCPAGDECNCLQEACNGQVESWAALQGAMLKGLSKTPTSSTPLPTASALAPGHDEERGRGRCSQGQADEPRVDGNAADRDHANKVLQSSAGLTLGRLKKTAGTWARSPASRRSSRKRA
ncbi:hypothetical protein CDD81_3092 [Ophiocordyceps australis]|uniref:Uncharacterized protein n=1 Tax=Ophiocordyceps australis TaxID=1399860 RepID=A0A2C5YC90_9HYPO|nr:hypothetical protein CDD81_3092 [Ophiocordyceps australis]